MAAEDQDSRTEDPTQRKIDKAREKGSVAKSMEVNTIIILGTGIIYFTFFGIGFMNNILQLWREYFAASAQYTLTEDSALHLADFTLRQLFYILAPLLFSVAVASIAANYWQNDGFLFSFEPLMPKLNKLNPLNGMKRFVSVEGFINLAKSLAKLAVVGTAVYLAMAGQWQNVAAFMELPVEQTLQMIGHEAFILFSKVAFALAFIAGADYTYQKYQYTKNLKMTKQEVKDERKDMEGNPEIKAKIKQKQFEFFRRRMMAEVPKAEVIITNPTHLSIALRYNRMSDPAPVVIAKGAGLIALKIREVAKENNIPIMENKPLAQTLFKTVDMGDVIPETLYKAVAEILAYVYKIKRKAM
ncbi:MAG: flagellar biosynthesis protein FlhB [Nitrospinae bacterium]|nr:flagellar biosynthesis protein FlhB [Nitrospinota bacterium]